MAKAPVKTEENLPATTAGNVPAFLAAAIAEHAGEGVSTLQEDNLVPLIYVLQAQSPQCNKRSPEYVDQAEAGSIWLRNSGLPAVNGEEGILFQPCFFERDWVEWVPRDSGGGYAGRHKDRPAEAKELPDPKNPAKTQWTLPNGNTLAETRYHIGYVILDDGSTMPYVIPMSSSGHTVSRGWMFMMNSKQLGGNRAPSYACLYRLKTKERSNAAGTWFTWDVTDAGWVTTQADFDRGADLHKAFALGEKQVDTAAPQDEEAPHGENAAM